jgi:hypothetical protein
LEQWRGHANDKDGYENDERYYHIYVGKCYLYKNIIQSIIYKVVIKVVAIKYDNEMSLD